ncbi:MAG: peptidyl-prolyl cis-trans isomerase, EpsD family [Thiobacillus sp.]|nr:peptidyl-prolyl cis-trans isomerase, EpsD family [Thiobacillus sp.]
MNYGLTKSLALSCMLLALITTGCDSRQKAASTDAKPAMDVAAKVNGAELPAEQVEQVAKRLANSESGASDSVKVQAVRSLVDQEVAAQKAVADKLDQDPEVVQALDMARRQILAEAYMNRKLGKSAEPTDAAVSEYYDQHPELFAKRKIYRLQELSIKAGPDKQEAIRTQLAASKTLNDFAEWLKRENLPVKAGEGVKSAEQLPLDLLPKLAQMPDGQALVVNSPDGVLVVVLADSQLQPATLEQAKPAIARMLQTQTRQKAVKAELDALKSTAKIEYLGRFADAGKPDTPSAATEPKGADSAPAPANDVPAGNATPEKK